MLDWKTLNHSFVCQNLSPFSNTLPFLFPFFPFLAPSFLFLYGFFLLSCPLFINPFFSNLFVPPLPRYPLCSVIHSTSLMLPLFSPVLWLLSPPPLPPAEPPPGKAGSGPAAGQGAAAGWEPGPGPRGGKALAVRLQPATRHRPLRHVCLSTNISSSSSSSPFPIPFFFSYCTSFAHCPAHIDRQVPSYLTVMVFPFTSPERLVFRVGSLFQKGHFHFTDLQYEALSSFRRDENKLLASLSLLWTW